MGFEVFQGSNAVIRRFDLYIVSLKPVPEQTSHSAIIIDDQNARLIFLNDFFYA